MSAFLKKINFPGILALIAGSFIAAVAVNIFYLPIKLTMGGVSGVASIIFQTTHILPMGMILLLINVPIFIIGFKYINLPFIIKSGIGTVASSLAIDITSPWLADIYESYLSHLPGGGLADPFVFAVIGGVVYGIGYGLIFAGGFTTGGTDILAKVIQKFKPNFSIGQALMILEGLIIAFATAVYFRSEHTAILLGIYSLISVYITSKCIDLVLEGFAASLTSLIITTNAETIRREIFLQLDRGCTEIDGRGAYTGEEKTVMLCVISPRQLLELRKICKKADPAAFVILVSSYEILGDGFSSRT
ncbi:MAG: YitT family protein [Clostridiales bacterium]|nr:YitT family protein [Clostridiales bacterium]